MRPAQLVSAIVALAFVACTDAPVALDTDLEPQFARGGVQLPSITGGGITINNNSTGGVVPELLAIGGFSAQATAAGVDGTHPVFRTEFTVYPATGQVEAKSVPAADRSVQLGSLHAEVVCIANLGPAKFVDGGGLAANEDTDIWEIRIKVTNSSNAGLVGLHGSIFVQDNGRGRGVDFSDENFDAPNLGNAACGVVSAFGLEPVLQGSVTVRD